MSWYLHCNPFNFGIRFTWNALVFLILSSLYFRRYFERFAVSGSHCPHTNILEVSNFFTCNVCKTNHQCSWLKRSIQKYRYVNTLANFRTFRLSTAYLLDKKDAPVSCYSITPILRKSFPNKFGGHFWFGVPINYSAWEFPYKHK